MGSSPTDPVFFVFSKSPYLGDGTLSRTSYF